MLKDMESITEHSYPWKWLQSSEADRKWAVYEHVLVRTNLDISAVRCRGLLIIQCDLLIKIEISSLQYRGLRSSQLHTPLFHSLTSIVWYKSSSLCEPVLDTASPPSARLATKLTIFPRSQQSLLIQS